MKEYLNIRDLLDTYLKAHNVDYIINNPKNKKYNRLRSLAYSLEVKVKATKNRHVVKHSVTTTTSEFFKDFGDDITPLINEYYSSEDEYKTRERQNMQWIFGLVFSPLIASLVTILFTYIKSR